MEPGELIERFGGFVDKSGQRLYTNAERHSKNRTLSSSLDITDGVGSTMYTDVMMYAF